VSSIKILRAGFFTTVQDIGRRGYQKFGMPVAGVMDNFSYRVANFLVGNNDGEAVLEATFLGPELEFSDEMVIAVTGANMKPKLNGKEIPMWESVKVNKGDKLALGGILNGIRSYIAFSGYLDIELVNNSKSTYVKSGIGGFEGRKLIDKDELKIKVSNNAVVGKYLDPKYFPIFSKKNNIRVILGPQDDYFTQEGINSFLNSDGYKITKEADRMGYRLEGEIIKHKENADIISDGALFGSVQVPANGCPIILMADRQTAGGYTKIATVISSDLPKISQMGSDNEIVFEKISLEESHEVYREYEKTILKIKEQILKSQRVTESVVETVKETNSHISVGPLRKMNLVVNGINYAVDVQEVK
jgi:biotin-dependent carboxylase-like uncharacterized protein